MVEWRHRDKRQFPDRRQVLSAFGTGVIGLGMGSSRTSAAERNQEVDGKRVDGASSAAIIPAGTMSVMERSLSRAGAVGDGKTIDTGPIQDAIAEVEHNTRFEIDASNSPFLGPGELVWPQGLFLVDDAIRITRSLRMRGEGQAEFSSGARIQQQRAGRDLFLVEPIAQGCSIGLSNLVLRANGGGASGGALLRIAASAGQCNSVRITDVVFGTPQTHAINIARGDDILISRCLFDVSATQCLSFGGPAARDTISNLRIIDSYFFEIAGSCITLQNANGVVIQGNHSLTAAMTRTFLNMPPHARPSGNIVVSGNTIRNADCFVDVTGVDGLVVQGNVGDDLGAGVQPRRAVVVCAGNCAGVVITGNRLKGPATLGFYDDARATVSGAVITGNAFAATDAKGAVLKAGNTAGRIGENSVTGRNPHGVGYRWKTSNTAAAPGKVAARSGTIVTLPVESARQGDTVVVDVVGASLQDGIMMTAQTGRDTVRVRYANWTNMPISIPAHDLSVLVTR